MPYIPIHAHNKHKYRTCTLNMKACMCGGHSTRVPHFAAKCCAAHDASPITYALICASPRDARNSKAFTTEQKGV